MGKAKKYITCHHCGSSSVVKNGFYSNNQKLYQQYLCNNCHRVFVPGKAKKESVLNQHVDFIRTLLNHKHSYQTVAAQLNEKFGITVTRQYVHQFMKENS
jgi:transposase-like protein